ncbi:hypothetical protein [Paenibacillus prosopidis]|uniref:Uncharacterized protein n=1 Tax=Paenibacillus prosopidis TaxID=630520 RepID=A0A368VHR3_9BACL|nr:hypothetical protein [Paenibacillus prosopidis]RCW39735.1 hypothetical protein DFP97_1531 [Paenibacillus prosopidis]
MSKKSRFIMLSMAILISVAGIFYYDNTFARSVAVVTVTEKGNDFIMIEKANGTVEKIKTTELVMPLIEVGGFYFITYYSNKLRSPFLKSIEPSESSF